MRGPSTMTRLTIAEIQLLARAIVAIDEASVARFGRFPWSRHVIARTIDAIAADRPKVIALDVLFTDPTSQEDDDALARSIGRAVFPCNLNVAWLTKSRGTGRELWAHGPRAPIEPSPRTNWARQPQAAETTADNRY